MAADNAAWLEGTVEETLEPELPICDPHHHLWDGRTDYVQARYLIDEVLADVGSGHNVVSTVFVECGAMYRADGPEELRPVGETEFVNGIAAMSASGLYGPCRIAAGIVGYAPLQHGAAVAVRSLDAHLAAGGGRFRGVRVQAARHESPALRRPRNNPPPNLYGEAAFRAGFAELAPRGLTFEAWCFHPQIPHLTDLARAFPDTTIILNHFGGPIGVGPYAGRLDETFAEWRRAIGPLAACPNVVAKLGGLVMEMNGFGFHLRPRPPSSQDLADTTRRYHETMIELFGVERCMFESNFPVDKVSCSYNVLWNSFKRLASGCSAAEKAHLFHDTAARVYRI